MSRNFDLLMQIESDMRKAGMPEPSTADRVATIEVVPIRSQSADGVCGEEMLRFIQRTFLSADGTAPRQVVLCGVDDENGSSSVCAMAGRTLAANSPGKVCLVDANVRSPQLASLFGIEGTSPFSGTSAPLPDQCVKIGNNLWLAGPNILVDKSRVLLPATELKERLGQLRHEFEYLLIDAPGTSASGDAQLLGMVADAAILVIEANSTRRLTARKARETLEAAGVRLLGTILNNRTFVIPETIYRKL